MAAIAAGLGGGLLSGAFGLAGGKAQAGAEKYAAQLQQQEANNALDFQKQEFNTTQANEAPWLKAGQGALSNLQAILAQPGQGWNQTFTAPTIQQAEQQPGYQFQLQQGEGALANMFAGRGDAGGGNEGEALTKYAEGAGQSDYNNVYNQAFQQYLQNYGQHNDQLNRLFSLSGLGQSTATNLAQQGQNAANTTANIDLTSGAQIGQDLGNAATATASGYTALGNALGGTGTNIMNLLMMQQMLGGGGGSASSDPMLTPGG